jgi:VIT1/CCC1 family predicted Fe2+/Mn2+ transporter
MIDLRQAISDFFAGAWMQTDEVKAANAITVLQAVVTQAQLSAVASIFPPATLLMPAVKLSYDQATHRISQEKDLGPFGGVAGALVGGFGALEGEMGKAAAALLQSNLAGDAAGIGAAVETAIGPAIDMMVSVMSAGGKTLPADITARLRGALLPVLTLGLTLEVATILAELIHPTKEMGFGGVSHFIHDTVGFQALADAYTRPVREAAIEIPTRYNIMRIMQPWAIRPQEARTLVQKRLLTPAQYAETLRYTGIQEQYVPLLQSDVWRELSIRDIQRIYDTENPSEQWTTQKLQRTGFADEDVVQLLKNLKKRSILADIGNVKALQRSQYKSGVLSRDDYSAKLSARGVTGQDASELLDAVDAERKFDQNKDLQNGYELKFLNGRSTETELRTALGTLDIVKYLTIKVLGKLKAIDDTKVLSRSDLEKQYAAGKLTKPALINALDVAGWSMKDATAIADLQDQDAIGAVRAELIRAAEQASKNLRFGKDELIAVYQANGKSAEWAAARADYIEQLIIGKVKTTEETAV